MNSLAKSITTIAAIKVETWIGDHINEIHFSASRLIFIKIKYILQISYCHPNIGKSQNRTLTLLIERKKSILVWLWSRYCFHKFLNKRTGFSYITFQKSKYRLPFFIKLKWTANWTMNSFNSLFESHPMDINWHAHWVPK